jgi:fructokinase
MGPEGGAFLNRIGIDLGGTKIEGILLGPDQQVLRRERIPTNRTEGYEAILKRIVSLVKKLTAGETVHTPIGVCTPGALDPVTGRLKNSNTLCLIGKPLKEDLEERLERLVLLENDANCFALAEATCGAGRGYDLVFGVIMGTGVGGGIVIRGQIHQGPNHIAGEWGHHVLRTNGNLCYCGKRGCVETYLSGPALEKQWKELTGESRILPEIVALDYHEKYAHWKQAMLDHFGQALSHVVDILDPDVIILGGGVSNIPWLYSEGKTAVYQAVFSDRVVTPIVQNTLGDSAGVFGAAMLEEKG